MSVRKTFLIIPAFCFAACGGLGEGSRRPNVSPSPPGGAAATRTPEVAATPAETTSRTAPDPLGSNAARELCFEIDTGDNVILKSQTFAIEFEPFRGSCFVTTHNPEFDEPPLESEIAIYRKDRRVFDFPHQFNGVTSGCWVEAVGFQDLNADGRIDVIVAGKCSARTAPYNEHMVYVNNGRSFTTNMDANTRLSEFSTVKDIAEFVRQNQAMFFARPR